MKKSVTSLREQAKKLLKRADKIEKDFHVKLGKITLKHFNRPDGDFSKVDIQKFIDEIRNILSSRR